MIKSIIMDKNQEHFRLITLGVLLYVVFSLWISEGLKFNMNVSDASLCWAESLRWKTPWNNFWVPGYPLLLAAIRGLTFNMLPPLLLMWLVSFAAYLVSISVVYKFSVYEGFAQPFLLAVLFAIFPFVGLARSVYPTSDISAIALMLLAMYAYRREQWVRFAVFAGGAMFFQKILWFFVPPLLVAAFLRYKDSRIWVPLAFLPITIWAVSGISHYNDVFWFLRTELLTSKTEFPIFDGIITPFFSGSIPKLAKGLFNASILVSVIYGIYYGIIHKLWLPLCTCLSLAIMCVIVNSYEIWAVARYSKLLVIPLGIFFHHSGMDRVRVPKHILAAIAVLSLGTNFAAAYYMSVYHLQ